MVSLEVVLGMFVLAVIALGGLGWLAFLSATAAGVTVLPWTPRRAVPWGVLDLFFVIAVFVLFTGATVVLLMPHYQRGDALNESTALALLWGDALSKFAVMLVATLYLVFLRKADRRDQGWTIGPEARFLPLGFITFVMLAPIVFAIQAALVQLGGWESKHPLVELVKELKSIPIFAAAFVATVIVAPLTEEWLFRVVLQGWLEKCFSGRSTAAEIMGVPQPPLIAAVVDSPAADTALTNPYQPPIAPLPPPHKPADEDSPPPLARTWPPILLSSLLFAGAHFSHGPDFIPLFIFAVGLGYVYQRTHSIVPSMIVHACLNLTSMVVLGAHVFK